MSGGPAVSAGALLRTFREGIGLSLDDLAARLSTEPRWSEIDRAETLRLVEADVVPLGRDLATALVTIAAREFPDFRVAVLADRPDEAGLAEDELQHVERAIERATPAAAGAIAFAAIVRLGQLGKDAGDALAKLAPPTGDPETDDSWTEGMEWVLDAENKAIATRPSMRGARA